jgi:hypothetical protein
MLIKIHKVYRSVVAVCDSEIVGRTFEEGIRQLNIKENFFNGEEIAEKELIEKIDDLAKEDATFFIAGKKSVSCAIKAGIVTQEGIGTVQEVPFALVLI